DAPPERALRRRHRLHSRGRTARRRDLPLGRWRLGARGRRHGARARRHGAVVIGADIRQYLGSLRRAAHPGAPCQMIAADFEALSHQVQKEIGMSEYHVPVLIGYSSGATVVYAALVESPPGTFA